MTGPGPDRLLAAQIAATAARHADRQPLTAAQEAAAAAELRETSASRADLLAEQAGLALGYGPVQHDPGRYELIARLCTAAGADEDLIERWIEIGRQRAHIAAQPPCAGTQ